jgi:hypothetical protein
VQDGVWANSAVTGPSRVAVFVTAAYGVSELPPVGEVSQQSFGSEPAPVRSQAATGPAQQLIDAARFDPCSATDGIPGLCDVIGTVQDRGVIFSIVDPFSSNGTLALQLQDRAPGEVNYAPLIFNFTTVATKETALAWLRSDNPDFETPPVHPYFFQAVASPAGALVPFLGSYAPNHAEGHVVSAPITDATVRVVGANPRRIIDPAAPGTLETSLDIPADVLSQLTVPTLTLTAQGPQEGQGLKQGDTITLTAQYNYGPRALREGLVITFASGVEGALTGEGCRLEDYVTTDANGTAAITCTLSQYGTIEVTASTGALLPTFDAPAILDQPLTAAANLTGEGCPAAHVHMCMHACVCDCEYRSTGACRDVCSTSSGLLTASVL